MIFSYREWDRGWSYSGIQVRALRQSPSPHPPYVCLTHTCKNITASPFSTFFLIERLFLINSVNSL